MIKFFNFLRSCCLFCDCPLGMEDLFYCSSCANFLLSPDSTKNSCIICLDETTINEQLCYQCVKVRPYYDTILAAYNYQKPLSVMLHSLKYEKQMIYSKVLSKIFYDRIMEQVQCLPDLVLYVPMHIKKYYSRGFNQVTELLQEFSRDKRINLVHALVRSKPNISQVGLNKKIRSNNLQDAFSMTHSVAGKNVVIVDDVVTTGATVNELAKLCKQNGAINVDVWCFLRTILK